MSRIAVLVFLLTTAAMAQRTGPGKGGIPSTPSVPNPTIQVRVVTQDERAFTQPARVQLLNAAGTPVSETFASDGMARFDNVRSGTYVLRVSGANLEDTTTAQFDVYPNISVSMQYVRVKLLPASTTSPTSGQPTISAYELNIPPKARHEFEKGGEAMQHGDWKKAGEHFDKAITIYPQYAAAYNNRGAVAMKMNDVPAAKAFFQKAIDYSDNSGSAYMNMGRLYLMARNFEQAGQYISKALALDPSNPEALTFLADCEIATGHYDEAIASVHRVHALPHQRFAVAHLIAASAYEKKNDGKDAAAEYQLFLKEDPSSPRAAAARKSLEKLTAAAQPDAAAPRP